MEAGGLMVSALFPGLSGPGSSPGQGPCVVFLGKTLSLTVPLSTQEYKWVPGGVTCDGLASRPGGVEILLLLHTTETGIIQKPG